MGKIIQYRYLPDGNKTGLMKPIIYLDEKYCEGLQTVSLNVKLAELLVKVKPERRTMKLERCFSTVIADLPMGACVKDFDVLFNPIYKVDALQILITANRSKEFAVLWPGTIDGNTLVYARDGYADYKEYDVEQYDITCVV